VTFPAAVVQAAFGDLPISNVAPLSGGMSGASIWSCEADGRTWVVREASGRWPNELACVARAAALGIAPALRHVDQTTHVIVMEHVAGAMFGRHPDVPRETSLARLGLLLRRLHDGAPFPNGDSQIDSFQRIDRVVREAGGQPLPDAIRATIERFVPVVARFPSAPCHKDVNPNNVIETAERSYLIDWETAAQGDPYFDLALFGVFGATSVEARGKLLTSYLGRAPSDAESARLLVTRVLALAHYAAAFAFVSTLQRRPAASETMSLDEVLAFMRTQRQLPLPEIVAAALLAEMTMLAESEAVADAARLLA